MSPAGTFLRLACLAAVAAGMTGCSSWRYRGFLDEAQTVGEGRPSRTYRIDAITFEDFRLDMAVCDNAFTQWIANRAYVPYYNQLAGFDTRKGGSYPRDIAEETQGFCSGAIDAVPVMIRLVPHAEEKRGFLSFLFPFVTTLGVLPSNKSRDIPFDIEVSFPDSGEARSMAAVVRIDSRFAFSPLGSNRFPVLSGTEACETMAGPLIFDSRNDLLRKAFVKTVAAAVRRAIAEREHLALTARAPVEYEKDEVAAPFNSVKSRPTVPEPPPEVREPDKPDAHGKDETAAPPDDSVETKPTVPEPPPESREPDKPKTDKDITDNFFS